MNKSPLSCALYNPYVIDVPFSNATIVPLTRATTSPLNGSYESNILFIIPSPFVSVRNSVLYPIKPLAGILNSIFV